MTQTNTTTQGGFEQKLLKTRIFAAGGAIIIGMAIMAAKFYAWHLTGSSAILSDALESIINVVAGGFALAAIIASARPPDQDHPYGHGKIEFFSAGFEGALITLAAFGIFKVGFEHLLHPQPLPDLGAGLLVLLGTAVVNLLLGIGLLKTGKKTGSLILEADGQHILADVYTSGGVLLGLFLANLTGWFWLDGAIACLVGLNILRTGLKLVRRSFAGLMDAVDPELLQQVVDIINRYRRPGWIDIHKLRVWRSGRLVHIDLHLILLGDLSLDAAHAEARYLENIVIAGFEGNASVLVHMDPCIDPDCAALVRTASSPDWEPADLTRQFEIADCRKVSLPAGRQLCGAAREKKWKNGRGEPDPGS
jgi:cation diffusion facilitator family transporter